MEFIWYYIFIRYRGGFDMVELVLSDLFPISTIDDSNAFRLDEIKRMIDEAGDQDVHIDLKYLDIKCTNGSFTDIIVSKRTSFTVYNNDELYNNIKTLMTICGKPDSMVEHKKNVVTVVQDKERDKINACKERYKGIIKDNGNKTAYIRISDLYSVINGRYYLTALKEVLAEYKDYKSVKVDFSGVSLDNVTLTQYLVDDFLELGNIDFMTTDKVAFDTFKTAMMVRNSKVDTPSAKAKYLDENFGNRAACLLGTYRSRNTSETHNDAFGRPGDGVPTKLLPALYLGNDGVNARFQVFSKDTFMRRDDYSLEHDFENHPGLNSKEQKVPLETLGIGAVCIGTRNFVNMPVQTNEDGTMRANIVDLDGSSTYKKMLFPQYMKLVFDEFNIEYNTSLLMKAIGFSKERCKENGYILYN